LPLHAWDISWRTPNAFHIGGARHCATGAYHEAGQAVMAFYLGRWVNHEGVEIDERRYCGTTGDFEALGD
jgi:hypothetical protein